MKAKIFGSIFFTSAIILVICFSLVFGIGYGSYKSSFEDALVRESELLFESVERYGASYLGLMKDADTVAILLDQNGDVEYSSHGDSLTLSQITDAMKEKEDGGIGYVGAFADRVGYRVRKFEDGRTLIMLSSSESALFSLLKHMAPAFAVLIGAAVISYLLSHRLTRSIVAPLSEMNPASPERARVYPELKPVISKLAEQNRTISRQLAELSQKENEFNSITAGMSEGMLVINSRAEVLSCNNAAKVSLGIVGEVPHDLLLINNSSSFRAMILNALSGKNGFDSIRTEDKFYSLLATPVFHGGVVDGAVIVILDDTEKEHREALRREFTSNISHELKTPLTSISGFAELIGDGMAEGEDARRFAVRIKKEAGRLIDLVSDIIRLNQVDGGEIPYDDGMISLGGVCADVIDRLSPIAERKGISLFFDSSDIEIRGNRRILSELVYNLVDNGIKYGKDKGYVRISLEEERDGCLLTVKDNGIGIPKGLEGRVFERFFRVDKSHSKEIGGTGLGLSIVKHAASYHGASIELVSEEGGGTEVRVFFQRQKNGEI